MVSTFSVVNYARFSNIKLDEYTFLMSNETTITNKLDVKLSNPYLCKTMLVFSSNEPL